MVRVRGIEGVLITADNYKELLKAISNEISNYEGFQPSMTIVDEKRAIIYHREIADEFAETNPWDGRYCCECGYYDLRGNCPHKDGRVTIKMDACHHFTVEIRGDDNEEV